MLGFRRIEIYGGKLMQVGLYPLDRAEIGNKTVYLGMDMNSVFDILGKSENFHTLYDSNNERHYYCNGELAIDFDKNNKVEFIELLFGIDGELQPLIYGISAFEENADKMVDLLTEKNNGEVDDSEGAYSYAFLEISVGIYRESVPQDIIESIEEAKSEGMLLDNEEIKEEMRRASHWGTIGIGIKDYYR